MTQAFEALEAKMQAASYRALSNCTVVTATDEFRAFFDNPDASMDVVTTGTPTLRYPTSRGLADGEAIIVNGVAYVVSNPPRRLASGLESIADLVPA
ncbi:hypothetical protein [Hydrogenophaga sp.]|uniref:head-tail joining protein n=1 Tax=Hydrogenophaga sp. TaxID=1904254 RepID=UPI00271BE406|nr:hypothetical protein [Hydrogenophaga sp.]MDO9438557.1 hypothetical protein [Hydrogenophaga sp.]